MSSENKPSSIAIVLITYFIVFTGILSFLVLLLLLSVVGVTGLGGDIASGIFSTILLPLAFDMILIAPGISISLLSLLIMAPLGLIIVVMLRIGYTEFISKHLPSIYRKFESLKKKLEHTAEAGRKYGLATLAAVSLGATIGPSTFILAPYTVLKYGFAGVVGFILASVISWLLAWRYSIMYYYAKYKIKGEVVGGPAFVKFAYGDRDPRYLMSRFMMWIGNSALAAFNMLIVIELVAEYLFKPLMGFEMPLLYRALLLLLLSLLILALHRVWERAVSLQLVITTTFVFLFFLHMFTIYEGFTPTLSAPTFKFNFSPLDFLFSVLSAAAYVYIVAFGFQEVIGLGENVKGADADERYHRLKNSMLIGTIAANIFTLLYIVEFYALMSSGVEIPATAIPVLDMLKSFPTFYWLTLTAIMLGIATTLVPAFVAGLKHLEQLSMDFIGVKTSGVLPYVVIILAWYLFSAGEEFLIHLTDFAVLVSLAFIALSEHALRRKAGEKAKGKWMGRLIAAVTLSMVLMLASTSRNIAEQSIMFMWLSTVIIMVLSYDLTLVEFFTVFVTATSIMLAGPLINLLTDLANLGILKSSDIPVYEASLIGLWSLYISLIAISIHLVLKYRDMIGDALFSFMLWLLGAVHTLHELIFGKQEE
ncbi:MAG: hypothetical protein J7J67_03285 [Thermoproteales archaeon]|nr:hypothetical protein [Thermoproteales archaeon]